MSQKRTKAQGDAIDARNRDVCVDAGAGSGKTFVLSQHFTGLVRDGVDPRRILTITFTERAARQMRERIARADLPESARRDLDAAWISTIHGFCARLLRLHALEAGVDPDFAVLPEGPAARVKRLALVDAAASFRREMPGPYASILDHVRWGKDEDGATGIARRVLDLHDGLRAAGIAPRRTLANVAPDAPLELPLDGTVSSALTMLAAACASYTVAFSQLGKLTPAQREAFVRIKEAVAALAGLDARPFSHAAYRAIRKVEQAAGGSTQPAVERKAVKQAAHDLALAYVEGPARAVGAAFQDLVARYDEAYRARKAARAALDFADLEERARDLLENDSAIRESVRDRFVAVLVDEFQDTSRIQQRIVDLVRREGALFAVGDVKQSIYGFRHAEVRGMLSVQQEVRRNGGLVVPLDVSFRTRPEVLASVDGVFSRVFGDPASEVPHQPLRSAVEVAFAPKEGPSVELLLARNEDLERARGLEARAVAARLAAIVEGKRLHGTNPLASDGSFGRPLRYRDCAILLRAMTALPVYERALRERGVPYRVAAGRGFFEAPDVVDATHLLKAVACPHDEVALLAALRSPLASISDDGLLALTRLASEAAGPRRRRDGALARALETVARGEGALDARDRRRVRAFAAVLAELRGLRGRVTARALLDRGLELTGLRDGALLRSGDARGYANLDKLLAIVEEIEDDGSLALEDVVLAIEGLRASQAKEAEASLSGGDEDAVSVLTVHAAKGDEWPLVVVADLGHWDGRTPDPLLLDVERGEIIPRLRDPDDAEAKIDPRSWAAIGEAAKRRDEEESKRILYVAMTRARDHLILSGSRAGNRNPGAWLAWTLDALDTGGRPLDVEPAFPTVEPVASPGPLARIVPTRAGPVRVIELQGDLALPGPVGPDAGARRPLEELEQPAQAEALVGPEERARAETLLARAARALPRADLSGSAYTVSEVLAWRACGRRYLYEQVVGARSPGRTPTLADVEAFLARPLASDDDETAAAGPDLAPDEARSNERGLAANALGTIVHALLESGVGAGARDRVRRAVVEADPRLDDAQVERATARALELARAFDESALGARARGATETRREQAFLARLDVGEPEPVLLRGAIDLVLRDEGGLALVDYKTNEITALEVAPRAEEYALQLQLYALAAEPLLGARPREAWLAFLAPGVARAVDVSEPALAGARDALGEFARARRTGDFPARAGSICRRCPFAAICPAVGRVAEPAPVDVAAPAVAQ